MQEQLCTQEEKKMDLVYKQPISSTLNSHVPVEILEIMSPKASFNDLVRESIFHREEIELYCTVQLYCKLQCKPMGKGEMESHRKISRDQTECTSLISKLFNVRIPVDNSHKPTNTIQNKFSIGTLVILPYALLLFQLMAFSSL